MNAELVPQITENESGLLCLSHIVRNLDSDLRPHASHRGLSTHESRVAEAYTTSDFAFMADLIDRSLLGKYLTADTLGSTKETLGVRQDTDDLARDGTEGAAKLYDIYEARIVDRVAEKGQYLPTSTSEDSYYIRTYKYGKQWDLSWEAWLRSSRDPVGALARVPQSWGLSARYTQEYRFTQAYAGCYTGGPGINTSFFTAAQGNYGTAVLANTSLAAAILALRTMNDPAGNTAPYMGKFWLVVPPALEVTAKEMLNSQWLWRDANVDPMTTYNAMVNAATLVVNPFLPVLDTTNGDTAWYLFCDPNLRPAVRYGYLTGYEQPEIFVKASDCEALGGGLASPYVGSFATDNIMFKLRFTFGADQLDYRGAYASDGTV